MKHRFASLLLTGLVLCGTVSCNSDSGIKLTENIIDDNYRNYYEIFVYSYCDSNGDQVGDLNGITSKLSYIRDLGYTGIWLTPIFPSSSLHKYNANDYFNIDSSFGTMEDFENLIAEAHKLGINVIMDLALNHSSRQASYFKKAVEAHNYKINNLTIPDDLKGFEDFYVFFDTEQEAKDSRVTTYKVSNYPFYYEGNFDSDMPEFNFDDENVWNEFDKILTFWQEKGVDGYRLDAVKYYYMNNSTKTIDALTKLNTIAKRNDPSSYLVGECWDSQGVIESYYESSLDSYFYFPGSQPNGFISASTNLNGANKRQYVRGLETMIETAKGHIPAPFLSNHDMSRANTSDLEKDKFLYGLLSMLNGTTFTYYGDEIGMGGTVGSDANVRTHMDWSSNDKGETKDPYSGTGKYNFAPVDEQLKDKNSLLNYYKLANQTRNAFPAIARGEIGETYLAESPDRQVRIEKTYEDENIMIVINFSTDENTTYETTKELVSYLPVYGNIIQTDNTYTIPAYGIAVFK